MRNVPLIRSLGFSLASASLLCACGAAPAEIQDRDEGASLDSTHEASTLQISGDVLGTSVSHHVDLAPPLMVLNGVIKYLKGNSPTVEAMINVTNIGGSPFTAQSVNVTINGSFFTGILAPYYDESAGPYTVQAGKPGYVRVFVPASMITPCTTYVVATSIVQPSTPSGLQGLATTLCPLNWTTPIDELHFGFPQAPNVTGKSLADIVSNHDSGRPDKQLCSACHSANGSHRYRPKTLVFPGGTYLSPYEYVGGTASDPDKTWAKLGSAENWATDYVQDQTNHTFLLRQAVSKWLADGSNL